jgi:hypothetical protein
MFLLDVNVLIALCDESHEFCSDARKWFVRHRASGWATCPLTENGMVRIMNHSAYGNGTTTPDIARSLLQILMQDPHHVFIPDDISICDVNHFSDLNTITSKIVTDLYLIRLARHHRMRLATFDGRMVRRDKTLSSELALIETSQP